MRTGNISSKRLTTQLTSECRTTVSAENIVFSVHQWEEMDGINPSGCSGCYQAWSAKKFLHAVFIVEADWIAFSGFELINANWGKHKCLETPDISSSGRNTELISSFLSDKAATKLPDLSTFPFSFPHQTQLNNLTFSFFQFHREYFLTASHFKRTFTWAWIF